MDGLSEILDTVIVGILAMPALLVTLDIISPRIDLVSRVTTLFFGGDSDSITSWKGLLNLSDGLVAEGFAFVGCGYLLGTLMFPVADFVLDRGIGGIIMTDDEIKAHVYFDKADWLEVSTFPAEFQEDVGIIRRRRVLASDASAIRSVIHIYNVQKYTCLAHETSGALLARIRKDIVVTRGALVDAIILFMVLPFGIAAARIRKRKPTARAYLKLLLLVLLMAIIGAYIYQRTEVEYDKNVIGLYRALKL